MARRPLARVNNTEGSPAEGTYRRAMELGKECASRYRRALAKLAQ